MSAVTLELLRFVAALNAAQPAHQAHQVTVRAALSFPELLTPGERWFLEAVAKLSRLSGPQQARLNEIASKVERGRR